MTRSRKPEQGDENARPDNSAKPGGGNLNEPLSLGQRPTYVGAKAIQAGLLLDTFRLDEVIGRGGMGEVWKAWDTVAERSVVVKLLPAELQGHVDELERVRETFQRVHALQHQHICPAYVLGHSPVCGFFVVMKYVPGLTLGAWRRQYVRQHGAMSLQEVRRLLIPIAEALDYAHRQKVIHRDVKPQNILVSADGTDIQIIDFGLAADIRSSLTRVSRVRMDSSGTLPYMAPEQWKGAFQDASTDQYALGVVAFELITGRLPFEAPDEFVLRECVLKEPVLIPEDIPKAIGAVLQRSMAKSRDARFASCGQFVAELVVAMDHVSYPRKSNRSTKGPGDQRPAVDKETPSEHLRDAHRTNFHAEQKSPPEKPDSFRKSHPAEPKSDHSGGKPSVVQPAKTPSAAGSGLLLTTIFATAVMVGFSLLIAWQRGWILAEVARIPSANGRFALLQDESLLVTQAVSGNLAVFNPHNGEMIREFPVGSLSTSTFEAIPQSSRVLIGFSMDSNAAVPSEDSLLRLFDLATGEKIRSFAGSTATTTDLAVSADGKWFIAASEDQTLGRWNIETGANEWTIAMSSKVTTISLQPMDGFGSWYRLILGTYDGMFHVADVASGRIQSTFSSGTSYAANAIQQGAFGNPTLIATRDGLFYWDVDAGVRGQKIETGKSEVLTISLSSTQPRIFCGSYDFHSRLIDYSNSKELRSFRQKGVIQQVAISKDGTRAWAGDAARGISVWRLPQ